MAEYYADSSVLVKRHVPEIGTGWFHGIADSASGNIIMTVRISVIEMFSALNRRVREGTLDAGAYAALAADVESVCTTQYRVIELSEHVVGRTRAVLERHPLRAYDAVQLAAALSANDALLGAGFTGADLSQRGCTLVARGAD